MTIRRSAGWQRRLDERILERLDDEPWSIPAVLAIELPIEVTTAQVRERCLLLADVGLVAVDPEDAWTVELTTTGRLYLQGEADVGLYPPPRPPAVLRE